MTEIKSGLILRFAKFSSMFYWQQLVFRPNLIMQWSVQAVLDCIQCTEDPRPCYQGSHDDSCRGIWSRMPVIKASRVGVLKPHTNTTLTAVVVDRHLRTFIIVNLPNSDLLFKNYIWAQYFTYKVLHSSLLSNRGKISPVCSFPIIPLLWRDPVMSIQC